MRQHGDTVGYLLVINSISSLGKQKASIISDSIRQSIANTSRRGFFPSAQGW